VAEWLLQECEVAVNPVDRFNRTPLEVRTASSSRNLPGRLGHAPEAMCNTNASQMLQPTSLLDCMLVCPDSAVLRILPARRLLTD
jgi:hypothetical protein